LHALNFSLIQAGRFLKQNNLPRHLAGVGNAKGTYLKAGDKLEAAIEGIGVLKNTMV